MAWLSGYTYRKKGVVNATTAGAQTNYQKELIVGESSGASGADVHCENHCLDFPNDIRFTKEDGETKHDYWVDTSSLEGTTPNRKVSVWIEVASIPASGSVDFYMYYRKSGDSGESSGDGAFPFFDDFDYLKSFNRISYGTLWSGSGEEDWLGRPVLLDNNSTWIAIYRQASSHLFFENAKFHIRFSTDQGTNWTAVDIFTDSNPVSGFPIQGHSANIADAIIIKTPNGDLLIHAAETTLTGGMNGTYQYRSINNGASWSDEGKINNDNTLLGGQDYIVVGSTIYIVVFVDPGADGSPPFYSALYKSINNGSTWTLVSHITSTSDGTNEPGIEYLGGTTLLCILRDDSGAKTYQRKSTDMGATWGTLTDITSHVSVVQRPRLRIFDDEPNRTYLFGRQKSTNSYTVVYYSMDNGATWTEQFYPDPNSYTDTGYCDMLKKTNGDFYMLSYGGTFDTASIKQYIFEKTTSALDPSKWNTVGTPTISFANSIMSMECDAEEWIESKTYTQSPPAKLHVKSKDKDYGIKDYPATYGWGDFSLPVDSNGVRREINTTATYCLLACNSSTSKYTAAIAKNINFANYKLTWRTAICHIYEDGVKKDADDITSSIPTGALDVRIGRGFYASELNKFDVDWIFTCKYASPEPTWGSWGVQTTQKTVTVNAILVDRKTKTFTADAILKEPITKTFVSDAILKKTSKKTYVANAVLINRNTKTFTADAQLGTAIIKTFTCDSTLVNHNTKLFSSDAILSGKITGITRNFGGSALGNCTVWLFKTSDKSFVDATASNVNGEYSFDGISAGIEYFIRAFKDGTPNVFGTTDDNLEAT